MAGLRQVKNCLPVYFKKNPIAPQLLPAVFVNRSVPPVPWPFRIWFLFCIAAATKFLQPYLKKKLPFPKRTPNKGLMCNLNTPAFHFLFLQPETGFNTRTKCPNLSLSFF